MLRVKIDCMSLINGWRCGWHSKSNIEIRYITIGFVHGSDFCTAELNSQSGPVRIVQIACPCLVENNQCNVG